MAFLSVVYTWKLFTRYLTIPLHIFGFSGWRVSLGVWCRFTQDALVPEQSPRDARKDTSSPYTYRQLDSTKANIRLLELEPGAFEDPLVGQLREFDLNEVAGGYIALSYAWGSLENQKELQLEGSRKSITFNLDKALRYLRSRTTRTTVWVDAVCIDQANIPEREHQVSLMAQLYAQSETVFSWLGEATQHSATGVEVLSHLASNQPFNDNSPWNRIGAREIALGLEDILQRAYFRRLWIVQEAALGRRIRMQVGNISFQWDGASHGRHFLTQVKLLEVSPAWQAEPLKRVDLRPIRELLEQGATRRDRMAGIVRSATLLDIVHTMRHMQSSDPRDRIYGLMGLASPADVAGFSPDYTDTWEGTYQKFFDHVSRNALQNPSEAWKAS